MNIEEFYDFCLSLPGAWADFPFGEDVLTMKVGSKMFALTNLKKEGLHVNLKCDPTKAINLREEHTEVQPGYHMNKKHWNTVDFNGGLSNQLLATMIKDSYDLVVKSLPKSERELLKKQ